MTAKPPPVVLAKYLKRLSSAVDRGDYWQARYYARAIADLADDLDRPGRVRRKRLAAAKKARRRDRERAPLSPPMPRSRWAGVMPRP